VRSYLRSLDPRLPRSVWILQGGSLASAVAFGIFLPFSVIYLHDVRGIPLGLAGVAAALLAAAGIVASPLAGALADRIGARLTLAGSLVLFGLGVAGYALVHSTWAAFVASTLAGIGNGGTGPTISSLLAAQTPPERRHGAYAIQRVTVNLGFGIGGLVGGLIATTSNPDSFVAIFLIAGGALLAFVPVLLLLPTLQFPDAGSRRGSYRDVLRRRVFVALVALNVAYTMVGYGLVAAVMPVFAKNDAGVSERQIGLIFLANTLFIVILQLPIARKVEGRRRAPTLAATGLLFAAASLGIYAGGSLSTAAAATVVIALAGCIQGLGECLHAIVIGPLVADLAPPGLLGRYMGMLAFSMQLGLTLAPAIGGFVLTRSPAALWIGAAALVTVASAGMAALEPRLPESVRITPAAA
jgi:MFS family permease